MNTSDCYGKNSGSEKRLESGVQLKLLIDQFVNVFTCSHYVVPGDLMDEESVLDFLTSLEAMDLPDRIEEVNARILEKIVLETEFVAVLFCKYCF